MGKRGPKPKGKVKIKWSRNFAYAIGLLVTDGNMSPNGRHIVFVSKDKEQLENFKRALKIKVSNSHTRSGYTGRTAGRVQFSDVQFWKFLWSIGIMPNKSKIIGKIDIPRKYFMDFFRGCIDGDGSFYSYVDLRWKSSIMFYLALASASPSFIKWIRTELCALLRVRGHITSDRKKCTHQLKYAKKESLKIIKNMYYSDSVICLSRKRRKIEKALKVAGTRFMPR